MDDEQKPNTSSIVLGFPGEGASAKNLSTKILKRTSSFEEWMNKSSIAHTGPQDQLGQISVKTEEPWSPPSKTTAYLQSLESASKDWVPTKPPKNRFQSHYLSHDQEPAMVPFSPPNTINHQNHVKLLPRTSGIPKKPHSGLKTKARESPLAQPNGSPSPSTSDTPNKPMDKLQCAICQISCVRTLTMQQHLKGRPHKAELEYIRLKEAQRVSPKCVQVWCSAWAGIQMHFNGQKHKAQLQEMELCKENGGLKISRTPIICELCLVPCMNEDLYKMHLQGRPHATKEELRRRGML